MLTYLTGQLLDPTETNINERVKYTAHTGMAQISTANSNLDGSGTLADVLVGASNGTYIKTITIQATTETTPQGVVRIFVYTPGYYCLIEEVEIPMVLPSGNDKAWAVSLDVDFYLKTNYTLKVSTEKANTFNVIAEAYDYSYP